MKIHFYIQNRKKVEVACNVQKVFWIHQKYLSENTIKYCKDHWGWDLLLLQVNKPLVSCHIYCISEGREKDIQGEASVHSRCLPKSAGDHGHGCLPWWTHQKVSFYPYICFSIKIKERWQRYNTKHLFSTVWPLSCNQYELKIVATGPCTSMSCLSPTEDNTNSIIPTSLVWERDKQRIVLIHLGQH